MHDAARRCHRRRSSRAGITRGFSRRCPASSSSAVVDINARARDGDRRRAWHARARSTARELLGQVDAVTVAVPTELHREIALPFLQRGVHVLVEKPMARIARRSRRDDRRRRRQRARCSPSATPSGSIRPSRPRGRCSTDPRFIEVHRLGTFPERSLDIDVVFDLMIHDLDVVLSLVQSEVDVDRGGRRAGADRPSRHRQRAAEVRATAASPTSRPAASAGIACARSGSSSPTSYVSIDYAAQEARASGGSSRATARCRRSRAAKLDVDERGAAEARAGRLRRRRRDAPRRRS